jgi:hypothetical protein
LWQRQYPVAWQALASHVWTAPVSAFVAALAERLRGQLLELLSTAYSSVRLGKVAALCGLTESEALAGKCACN